MSELQRHADDVIRRLDRRRKAHACYPCAKRKVRCYGGQPCSICKKRGHPEICFFAKSSSSRQPSSAGRDSNEPAAPAGDDIRRNIGASNVLYPDTSGFTDANGREMVAASSTLKTNQAVQPSSTRTAIGSLSGATYVQHALSPHTTQDLGDIRSGLGLENVPTSSKNASQQHQGSFHRPRLVDLCPKRSEVLRFLQSFRTQVAAFYPIILSIDELEVSIHQLLDGLELHSSDSLQPSNVINDEERAADVALFLSVLAVGAQFADAPSQVRETQSQGFIERCDACLRLARYTANPSPQIVQTLILIGLQAQNAGRSDEAWSLLGLTFRLAQSLGMEGRAEADQHFLWASILWQDALLSLRYDRKPIYTRRLSPSQSETGDGHGADYFACMHDICNLTRAYLLSHGSERSDAKAMQERITNLALIKNRAAVFLRSIDRCKNIQERLKYYALRMHTSFLTSEMCRSFFIKPATTTQPTEPTSVELHQMGVSCLQDTVEAYLKMSQLSIFPLRSWSLTSEVFVAVCVLTLLGLRNTSERADSLLREFQLFLERELASETAHETAAYSPLQRGRKLFKLLERSAQYTGWNSVGRSHRGPPGDTIESDVDRSASQTQGNRGALDEQPDDFGTFVDKFWESVPFNEPDGTLLSLFDDPFYNEFSTSNTSPNGSGSLVSDVGNKLWS